MKNHHKKRLTRAQKIEAARKGLSPKNGDKVVKINGELFVAQLERRYPATPEFDQLYRQAFPEAR